MRGRLGSELQKIAVLSECPYLRAFRHSSAGARSVRELNKGCAITILAAQLTSPSSLARGSMCRTIAIDRKARRHIVSVSPKARLGWRVLRAEIAQFFRGRSPRLTTARLAWVGQCLSRCAVDSTATRWRTVASIHGQQSGRATITSGATIRVCRDGNGGTRPCQ
jgi:hypothetical protein